MSNEPDYLTARSQRIIDLMQVALDEADAEVAEAGRFCVHAADSTPLTRPKDVTLIPGVWVTYKGYGDQCNTGPTHELADVPADADLEDPEVVAAIQREVTARITVLRQNRVHLRLDGYDLRASDYVADHREALHFDLCKAASTAASRAYVVAVAEHNGDTPVLTPQFTPLSVRVFARSDKTARDRLRVEVDVCDGLGNIHNCRASRTLDHGTRADIAFSPDLVTIANLDTHRALVSMAYDLVWEHVARYMDRVLGS